MATVKGECVMWPGAVDKDGYGFVKIRGKQKRAHRVAMEKRLGRDLKPTEIVMHLCHHPGCVNANHLKVGTVAENSQMALARRTTLAKSVLGVP